MILKQSRVELNSSCYALVWNNPCLGGFYKPLMGGRKSEQSLVTFSFAPDFGETRSHCSVCVAPQRHVPRVYPAAQGSKDMYKHVYCCWVSLFFRGILKEHGQSAVSIQHC